MEKSFENLTITLHLGKFPWLAGQELVSNINTDVLHAAVFEHEGRTDNERVRQVVTQQFAMWSTFA